MPPTIALIACIIFIIWLLRIERKRNPAATTALWVPTIWLCILASRSVGHWFGYTSTSSTTEGSVYDQYVLSIHIILSLYILSKRNIEWNLLIKNNRYLIILYIYLGLSCLWSEFPIVSFRRWVKIAGTIIMACVVSSEKHPFLAMESVLRRCAYVLIPLSILLIKYFPFYGIQYTLWEGTRMGVGVTTHKNTLGVLCAYLVFILIWANICKYRKGDLSRNVPYVYYDVFVIGIALFLLLGGGGTSSATSILVCGVGIVCLLLLRNRKSMAEYVASHLKPILMGGIILILLYGYLLAPTISTFFNRDETLTGRTDIWSAVLNVAANSPVLGTGYGVGWEYNAGYLERVLGVKQSHNGYLEVYLNVGIVGLIALFSFFLEFCGKIRKQLSYEYAWCICGLCYLIMELLYNYSEAGFTEAKLTWTIMVYLALVFSAPACIKDDDLVKNRNHEA